MRPSYRTRTTWFVKWSLQTCDKEYSEILLHEIITRTKITQDKITEFQNNACVRGYAKLTHGVLQSPLVFPSRILAKFSSRVI